MYQRITTGLLEILKVPHEPEPPHGNPSSLRVFRAGRNYFKLRLLRWGITQLVAFAGIVFWLSVFIDIEIEVSARRRATPAAATAETPVTVDTFAKTMQRAGKEVGTGASQGRKRVRGNGWAGFKRGLVQIALALPWWAFPLLWALKLIGILVYFVQLPITYLVARLDYELRWYMVTDRSLRIRHGVWKVSESTMSFANIQQVEVSQGPLQRLLGLANVRVQSAGGGGGDRDHHRHDGEDMHLGLFHSVTNAPEIRDLILERLRRFRESGLGDPEEKPAAAAANLPVSAAPSASADTLHAARELLAEAKALRAALS